MSSTEIAISAKALKGELCTLQKIHGIKELYDQDGLDLMRLIKNGSSGGSGGSDNSRLEKLVVDLVDRVNALEQRNLELSKLMDVDTYGIKDGAMLVWSGKLKKWVITFEE